LKTSKDETLNIHVYVQGKAFDVGVKVLIGQTFEILFLKTNYTQNWL